MRHAFSCRLSYFASLIYRNYIESSSSSGKLINTFLMFKSRWTMLFSNKTQQPLTTYLMIKLTSSSLNNLVFSRSIKDPPLANSITRLQLSVCLISSIILVMYLLLADCIVLISFVSQSKYSRVLLSPLLFIFALSKTLTA